ncbi:MAG: DUF1203 domain-containing protein [Burkholderiales bacterium]|nr:DUF1203 domain-containing protein [Burkholderiales bacterium]
MSFRITGLPAAPFQHLFGLPDAQLAALGVQRQTADAKPGFPDRITLRDAEPGEAVLLLNYQHQPTATPYRASHAIFVLEDARETFDAIDTIPDAMAQRLLSLRAFDAQHWMVDADVVEGKDAAQLIERLFANGDVAYIQAHYARRGCYAARIERA